MLEREGSHHLDALRVDGDSEHRHLSVVGGLERVQDRDLLHAGRAPGRPEVDDHGPPEVIGQRDLVSSQIAQRELRGPGAGDLPVAPRGALEPAAEDQQQESQGQGSAAARPHSRDLSAASTTSFRKRK
jgi:hypothetical protein